MDTVGDPIEHHFIHAKRLPKCKCTLYSIRGSRGRVAAESIYFGADIAPGSADTLGKFGAKTGAVMSLTSTSKDADDHICTLEEASSS